MEKLQEIFKSFGNIKPIYKTVFIFLIFLTIATYTNLRSNNIFDPDSFYHIRHSWYLRTNGIFNTDFPWTYFSNIHLAGADLWYGFHIFLIPFTYMTDLAFAIKVSGVVITFIALVSIYIAFKNLDIRYAWLFVVFMPITSSWMMYRMAMARPHDLSLAFLALIFSFFYSGSSWPVFIFSFLSSWIHSAVFWLPFIAVGPIVIFKFLNGQRVGLNKILSLVSGTATGLMARPHPVANIGLIYNQVIDFYLVKGKQLKAMIGTELQPPEWVGQGRILFPIFFIFFAGLIIAGLSIYKKEEFSKETKVAVLSSFIMVFFSFLMFVTANRAIDLLTLFIVMFAGLAFTHYLSEAEKLEPHKLKEIKIMLFCLLVPFLTFSACNTLPRFEGYFASAMLPYRFQGPALWLKQNSNKGDIVFHLYFDQFPSLFFWNQDNYYTYGMDPIFLYKYDTHLYWDIFYLNIEDTGDQTCDAEYCTPDHIKSTYDAITKDFHASYVFTRRFGGQTSFLAYLEKDTKHFKKVYDQDLSVIFKVLPEKK